MSRKKELCHFDKNRLSSPKETDWKLKEADWKVKDADWKVKEADWRVNYESTEPWNSGLKSQSKSYLTLNQNYTQVSSPKESVYPEHYRQPYEINSSYSN